jgi:hypothetical protein
MADYFNIGLDDRVSAFDICQAHAQLEADYNLGGWLRERPSNQRRREATSCQLQRMGYSDSHRWVEICADRTEDDDSGDEHVREIYLRNVLRYDLPIDAEMMACIKRYFTAKFLAQYPQCAGSEYKQGR